MNRNDVDVTILEKTFSGGNAADRVEMFRDLALGMFIHWSCDSLLGSEISHPLVGASERILRQYHEFFPSHFNPRRFDPEDYAELADAVGMNYFCFTAKHHSGFCMFDTKTTRFNVMNSRYGRDVTREFIEAFRRHGLRTGIYFSPLDFEWLYNNRIPIRFLHESVIPANNPGLMEYNRRQVRELLANYGKIDLFFFDGPPEGLKQEVWRFNRDILVTRGEMATPEQEVPDTILDEAWESCCTIGSQWNWHPRMVADKTARQLVELLIETRAKGGNLLLNVTPAPDGTIPQEQESLLRELGLWLFWHRPAIYEVRPYKKAYEELPDGGRIWYTQSKDRKTIFAFLVDGKRYDRGQRREFLLTVPAMEKIASVELLGQNGTILEHSPENADIKTRWEQSEKGVSVSAVRCLRPCGASTYDMPYVLRISLHA